MELSSSAFLNREPIPLAYTCQGMDAPPPLSFSKIPEGTETLALIMDDPDAPGGTWTHWVLWDLAPTEGDLNPSFFAKIGTNSWGLTEWGGPCPPSGVHRYFFNLYALDTALDLPTSTTADLLREAMQGHILDEAVLMGTYQKTL